MDIKKRQRQISDTKAEPRAVRQRMRDQAAEPIVPTEVGVAIVRLWLNVRTRGPRQPLHGGVRLHPRRMQEHEVGARDGIPGHCHIQLYGLNRFASASAFFESKPRSAPTATNV